MPILDLDPYTGSGSWSAGKMWRIWNPARKSAKEKKFKNYKFISGAFIYAMIIWSIEVKHK